jgi:hypothetical protein
LWSSLLGKVCGSHPVRLLHHLELLSFLVFFLIKSVASLVEGIKFAMSHGLRMTPTDLVFLAGPRSLPDGKALHVETRKREAFIIVKKAIIYLNGLPPELVVVCDILDKRVALLVYRHSYGHPRIILGDFTTHVLIEWP